MIDRAALLADLRRQVTALEDDLRERAAEVPEFDASLRKEWREALEAERTAASYESWLEGQVTQAAVAWVLGTVFLRFCEDNDLIDLPYLAGPGDRLELVAERQQQYFENNPEKTDRDWIVEGFHALAAASPVAAGLFDRTHNPMWRITPSHPAAKALLGFWRTRGEDGEVVHDFTDDEWNTRFLGDLYQDLSEHAKKTYALLQTPEFVEDFILDLTLEPAVDEFGLTPEPPNARPDLPKGLRVIDPTCGSGHFLLGAFHRLLAKWRQAEPTADSWDLINRVLYSVHGVDKNPFAVSIARFRLLIAAMKEAGVKRLANVPNFYINVAVGDSLIHGRGAGVQDELLFEEEETHTFATEDVGSYIRSVDILGSHSYHVVIGNPPYITVKDKKENENYRKAYHEVCSGKYALSAPFAYRFFYLAKLAGGDRRHAGYVGQITANSFMKREFGKKLIEDFFRLKVELTHLIDTSGAYIPGHGTPTVILVGRNMMPTSRPIRAALGVRGEPNQPENPARGQVWRSIVTQIHKPGSEDEWITVTDLERERLSTHPWSLSGGGADALMAIIASHPKKLGDVTESIGFGTITGDDEAYKADREIPAWQKNSASSRRFVEGDRVRDWGTQSASFIVYPYNVDKPATHLANTSIFWPVRTTLRSGLAFGKTREERGLTWFEYTLHSPKRYATKFSISFAFVATHNHFVLDRGGKVFNRSAPVIKLPEGASEDDHLALIGILNSSTACFWLKQVSHSKGNATAASGMPDQPWSWNWEFTGTKLQEFPLPSTLPLHYGREIDKLAQQLSAVEAETVCRRSIPARNTLNEAADKHSQVHGRMVALQEELDWQSYHLYGLLSADEIAELQAPVEELPEIKPGERAFEILLARSLERGESNSKWFSHHGHVQTTKVPTHWPEPYRRVVEKRIEVIEKRRDIALIEQPEHKRRWASQPWEKKEKAALRNWLLDRCEKPELWSTPDELGNLQPRPMTVNRLADKLREDADFVSVARLYAGQDADLAKVIAEITQDEHVPYLAALRYKPSGLRKRAQWEKTWDLQREEDSTNKRLDIPVPPKYSSADFLKPSYWRNRGKLDVPKERFISYPHASPDGDGSLLLGWAGWDHREQAHALMTLIEERSTRDGWERDRLIPLLAGLAEVMPWVRQWHGEIDPNFGMSPADAYAGYLEDQKIRHSLSDEDLAAWRPPANSRGRKPKAKKSE
ncbi:BREX-2 system adenine-specific DNA-methyltransferase PglX [Thermomonospora amylolytica]|uniref:BREX-2 system adenine-specific DNA-methyltransferase PglX n=1 Tax=Thermomonospora amylolytica TaxID=1411117 RepID=UPI000E6B8EC2|nr:BREX-2 system adenine-specific DNA-methyltransferase PglX [Thermomonospora amylolytica]